MMTILVTNALRNIYDSFLYMRNDVLGIVKLDMSSTIVTPIPSRSTHHPGNTNKPDCADKPE